MQHSTTDGKQVAESSTTYVEDAAAFQRLARQADLALADHLALLRVRARAEEPAPVRLPL
jgi:hypothetical protein